MGSLLNKNKPKELLKVTRETKCWHRWDKLFFLSVFYNSLLWSKKRAVTNIVAYMWANLDEDHKCSDLSTKVKRDWRGADVYQQNLGAKRD